MNSIESETIEASLRSIRFRGENHFIIGMFKDTQGNDLAALGNLINPQIDMDYILSGTWETTIKFGDQFKFHSYESVMPVNKNGIFKYLVRICKFVGPSTGNAIIDKYGDNALKILKTDPERINNEIPGLNLVRAKGIQESLMQNEVNEKVMIQLENFLDVPGMWKNLPAKLIEKFKGQAYEIVEFNPYILTQFRGIGFLLADAVALKNGVDKNDIERKKSCILHCLNENMKGAGSIWIRKGELFDAVRSFIMVPKIEQGIDALEDEGLIVVEEIGYSLFFAADDELMISRKVLELVGGGVKDD